MIQSTRTRILFKTIAGLMACIFLWQQVSWAGDLLESSLEHLNTEQSQTFAPSYLQKQQSVSENLIIQKQSIEDAINSQSPASAKAAEPSDEDTLPLKGRRTSGSAAPRLATRSISSAQAPYIEEGLSSSSGAVISVTTQAGDVITYKDGAIDSIRKKDGTVLSNIVVDENDNLREAEITYLDGTIELISGGKITKITRPDGTIYNYNADESIHSVVYPDSSTCSYSYTKDAQGKILETVLTDSEKVCHYNSDNKLTKVIFNDGKTIEYDNGIITRATDPDGAVYSYDTTENTRDGATTYLARLKTIVDSAGVRYDITDSNITGVVLKDKSITNLGLDEDGKIVNGTIEYLDGTKIVIENKKITKITDAGGITTAYRYSPDGLQCGVTIDDHGSVKYYTYTKDPATGQYTIKGASGTYEYDALWNLEKFTCDLGSFRHTYSTEGSYAGSVFTSTDGAIREYDATKRLVKTTFLGGTVAYYVYSGESIQAAIDTAKSGDTIFVHSGVYHEHIVLSSGVNIIGDYKASVIINGDYQTNSNVIRALGNNRIENITVSGGGYYSGSPSSAIRVEGDNVSIRNNNITDNRDYAVHIWSGTNTLIEKNFFKGNGLGIQLPDSGTTIQYNTFVNNNMAINVLNGPAPIIRNNIITGSTFQSIYEFSWAAYAAGLPASGYAIVEGNILYNNAEHGGYYCRCLPPAVLNQTSGNLISDPLYVDPASGNYSVPENSPAFGKGAFLSQALSDSLDNASGMNLSDTIYKLNTYSQMPAYALQSGAPVIFPDGKTDILNNTIPDTGFLIELPDRNTAYFDTITYDQNRVIKEILKADGEKITYRNGLVDTILSGNSSTHYSYTLSGLDNIAGITIDRDGIKRIYDQYGNISTINAGGLSMLFANGEVTRITKDDGTIIENAVFDANNSIISATITKPDGTKAIYAGGVVREIDQPDGSRLYYDANGTLTGSISSERISYSYTNDVEGGVTYLIATADNAGSITDPNAIIYQKFDSSNTLIQAKKKDGTIINYTYTKDASGKIVTTYANDGKSITTYDANNNITQVEVLPTADDPVPTISKYEYNQIRQVYKGDKLVYTYAYETDSDGKTITAIKDVTTGDVKRYKDSVLISVTDVHNVVTSYRYNSDGKVSQAIVISLGHVINTYTYTYNGDNTIIQDIDGIIRTYDKDNKIIQLEQNGRTYQYTYKDRADGTETTIQDLVTVKDDAGVITNYSQGNIQSIIEPDGTVITNVVLTNGNVSSYTIKKNGITYYVVNNKLVKIVKTDGTVITYNTSGLTTSLTDPSDKITQYSYVYSSSNQLQNIIATKDGLQYKYDQNGTFIETIDSNNNQYYYDSSNELVKVITANLQECDFSYANNVVSIYSSGQIKQNIDTTMVNVSMSNLVVDTSNNNPQIKLASTNNLDYGDGSDGAFNPTSNVVVSGIKNYTSINIPAGVTVSFDQATIKCKGSVLIAGTLCGDGRGYAGGSPGYSEQDGGSDGSGPGKGGGGYGCRIDHFEAASGGGGGYGTAGGSGSGWHGNPGPGVAGSAYGDAQITTLYMGSGGGAGGTQARPLRVGGTGGSGGGAIMIIAPSITVNGSVSACGANGGGSSWAGGGGGSGGTIYIVGNSVSISGSLSVAGGSGGSGTIGGGAGGAGRIRIDSGSFTGTIPASNPYMYQIPYQTQGQLVSRPIAIVATQFGHISANTNIPTGTNIVFMTRTGASANLNDGTWSDWIAATSDDSGYKINSSVNNFIQYEALLTTTDTSKTPSIYSNGDYAIKLDYSYNQSFDATAPPQNMPFKDFLTLNPNLPIAPSLPTLTTTFTQVDQITSVVENSILSNDTVIESQSSQASVLSQITMSDGTVVKYFNDQAVSATRSDGTSVANFDASAYSPDQVSGSKTYRQAQITLDISKDSKITTIIDNNPVSVYQQYADGHMTLLTKYQYDANGDLISISLPYARDSLAEQLTQARDQIALERANYLLNLAQQNGFATIQIQTQFAAAYSQIDTERAQLTPMLYQQVTKQRWVGWWIFGWWETYTETVEVPQVRNALNQLNEQERQLNIQEADAYAQLNGQIQSARNMLTADEATALTAIQNQQNTIQAQIINEETSPVVINYYRAILGRDPSDAELAQWVATVNYNSIINVGALKIALSNSAERSADEAFIESIKGSISDTLYAYVNADTAGKQSILSSLGLTLSDAITFNNKSDADALLSLLDKQNIHFGRSAFVSLQTLLSANNINSNVNDLAQKTILIDIFTGAFNPLTEGNLLELSMRSLSKTASLYGLNVYNTKLNYADLSQAFASGGTLIAHLKNNHYVDVTNISSNGTITYVEHNKGQNGATYTVSEKDFENSWTGYVITKVRPTDAAKILPDAQAQRIKGSCLFFLLPLIGIIIGAISSVVTAAVAAISVVVASISAILAPIISCIGALFTGIGTFMANIGSAIFGVISFVGDSLLPTIGAFFTNIGSFVMSGLSAFGSAIGNAIGFSNLSTLGITLGRTIVTTALSIGISKGLDALGVNPIVSNLISSFVTGGVAGLFNNFSAMGFIGGALQGLAIQTVSVVGQQLGIAPNISSIIGVAAGSLISAGLNGIWEPVFDSNGVQIRSDFVTGFEAISYSMSTTVLPNVASELVYSGVTEFGNMLGVDPRISYLAGIGIRSSLQVGFSGGSPTDIWNSVTSGLLQGVTSIGINYATQELGLNPLLANLGFSVIASALNAGIQASMPNGQKDVFKYMFDTYMKNTLTFLGYGSENNPWLQAAYMSQILDFSDIVRQKGLSEALNIYGAGFFNAVAVNEIIKTNHTLGGYFEDMLKTGQYHTETVNGKNVIAVDTPTQSDGGHTTAFFDWLVGASDWDPLGQRVTYGDGKVSWSLGEIGKDGYQKMGYRDATMYNEFGDLGIWQTIENGNQTYADVYNLREAGRRLFTITPDGTLGYNAYTMSGYYSGAQILNNLTGDKFYFHDNSLAGQTIVIDDLGRLNIVTQDGTIKSFTLESDISSEASMLSELASGTETSTGRQLSGLEKAFTAITLLSGSVSGLSIIDNPISDALVAAGVNMADSMYDNIFANKETYANALTTGMEAMGWGYNYFVNQSMEIGKRWAEDTWQNFLDISKGTAVREQRILDYANSLDYTNTNDVELENTIETSLSKIGTYNLSDRAQEEDSRKNEWCIIRSLEDYVKKDGSSDGKRFDVLTEGLQYIQPQKNQAFNDMFFYVNENVNDPSSGDAGVKEGVNGVMDIVQDVVETHTGTPKIMNLEQMYQRLNKLYGDIKNELAKYDN